ncbi:MAG: DEAD/DEAH box helicase, partial [Longimicrobiales bacterium]
MTWWKTRPAPETVDRAFVVRFHEARPARSPAAELPGEAHDDAARVVLRVPAAAYYAAQPPLLPWPHPFRPFQIGRIATLLERDALLLADDMGLGKTVQAIAALRVLLRRREIDDALIVVPASVLTQWSRAFHQWAPELRISIVRGAAGDRAWQWNVPAHVYVVSYETLRSDFSQRNRYSPPRRRVWGAVILDEAQKIKNRDADVSRVCKRLPRSRAWALTGTPLENRVDELASVCEFVAPWNEADPVLRLDADPDLLQRHAALQLRRRKQDVLAELPPKTVIDLPLPLTVEQRVAYERAEGEGILWLRRLGRTAKVTHVLELIVRLKQICNVDPETGASAKLDDLEERIETLQAEGHGTLVFSQFVDDHGVAAVADRLRPFRPLTYTGGQSANERDAVIRRFRSRPAGSVLIISLRAGGAGLDLPEASYVVHFDRWWNPAVERQAEDRAHRMGKREAVTVYRYIAEDTIEERIDVVLRSK